MDSEKASKSKKRWIINAKTMFCLCNTKIELFALSVVTDMACSAKQQTEVPNAFEAVTF